MDVEALKARALKARESEVVFDDVTFIVRRPTEMDIVKNLPSIKGDDYQAVMEAAYSFVVGWRGVPESFFDPDLGDEDAPFDADLLIFYLNEHVKTGSDLANAVWNLVRKSDDEKKTSQATSTLSVKNAS